MGRTKCRIPVSSSPLLVGVPFGPPPLGGVAGTGAFGYALLPLRDRCSQGGWMLGGGGGAWEAASALGDALLLLSESVWLRMHFAGADKHPLVFILTSALR